MKQILSLLFILFSISVFAQNDEDWKEEASKESQAYHAMRVKPSVPPHGLVKIKDLLKQIKSDDEENIVLSQQAYDALSLREKFTYHMIHAESFSQNCDVMPPIQNEQKKIFPYIPDAFDEYDWSERQTKFMSSNRDSVIALMKESIARSKRAGVNYKQAILEINAFEMIPDLVAVYNVNIKTRDLDLLTVMMVLMKENEYEPFLLSTVYKKLYGDEENSYKAYLAYSKANEDQIIKRAMEFYHADKK